MLFVHQIIDLEETTAPVLRHFSMDELIKVFVEVEILIVSKHTLLQTRYQSLGLLLEFAHFLHFLFYFCDLRLLLPLLFLNGCNFLIDQSGH